MLTRILEDFSRETWETMWLTHSAARTSREEYFTERLFVSLISRARHLTHFIPFPPHKEAINGADWEWWISDGRHWLGLLVQAKALDLKHQRYSKLDYKPRKANRSQLSLLIEDATTRGLTPIVACYNYSPTSSFAWNCVSIPRDDPLFGCSIIDAVVARELITTGKGKVRKGFASVAALSFPLRCLTACKGFSGGGSVAQRAGGVIEGLRSKGAERGYETSPPVTLLDTPPAYVRKLMDTPMDAQAAVTADLVHSLRLRRGIVVTVEPDDHTE
nr:DUF6615 family protein [Nitrosomonas nitrosa]